MGSGVGETSTLVGDRALTALRDYFETLHSTGATVHRDARQSVMVCRVSPGLDWPLAYPVLTASIHCDDFTPPLKAPELPPDLALNIEAVASGPTVLVGKRIFAAPILLMATTSLRFADVQHLKTLGRHDSSAFGALLTSKSKKPHGLDWAFGAPLVGFGRSGDLVRPIFDFRDVHTMVNGVPSPLLILELGYPWGITSAGPISAMARRVGSSL